MSKVKVEFTLSKLYSFQPDTPSIDSTKMMLSLPAIFLRGDIDKPLGYDFRYDDKLSLDEKLALLVDYESLTMINKFAETNLIVELVDEVVKVSTTIDFAKCYAFPHITMETILSYMHDRLVCGVTSLVTLRAMVVKQQEKAETDQEKQRHQFLIDRTDIVAGLRKEMLDSFKLTMI